MLISLSDYDKSCEGSVQITKIHTAVYLDDATLGWEEHQLAEPGRDPVIVIGISFSNIQSDCSNWKTNTILTAIYKPILDVFTFGLQEDNLSSSVVHQNFPNAVNGTILYDILMRAIIAHKDSLFDCSTRSKPLEPLSKEAFDDIVAWTKHLNDWQGTTACQDLIKEINKHIDGQLYNTVHKKFEFNHLFDSFNGRYDT